MLSFIATSGTLHTDGLDVLHAHQAVSTASDGSVRSWVTRVLALASQDGDAGAATSGCRLLAETLMQLRPAALSEHLPQVGTVLSRLVKRRCIGDECTMGDLGLQTLASWCVLVRRGSVASSESRKTLTSLAEPVLLHLVAMRMPAPTAIDAITECVELYPGCSRTLSSRGEALGLRLLASADPRRRGAGAALLLALGQHGGGLAARDVLVQRTTRTIHRLLDAAVPGCRPASTCDPDGPDLAVPLAVGAGAAETRHVVSGLVTLLRQALERPVVGAATGPLQATELVALARHLAAVRGSWDGLGAQGVSGD